MHFLIETAPTKGPLDGHEMNRKMRQTIYIYIHAANLRKTYSPQDLEWLVWALIQRHAHIYLIYPLTLKSNTSFSLPEVNSSL